MVAEFPKHMEDLHSVLSQVNEFHKVRQRLTAEMADNSGVIRNLVVRAEDARMMNDICVCVCVCVCLIIIVAVPSVCMCCKAVLTAV